MTPAGWPSPGLAAAFRRMAWALLFQLDFRVDAGGLRIDVLPDAVGWLLFASGLAAIEHVAPPARRLRSLASWLAALSLVTFVRFGEMTIALGRPDARLSVLDLLDMLLLIPELIFLWRVGAVAMTFAGDFGRTSLAQQADSRRRFIVAVKAGLAAGVFVALVEPSFATVLVLVGIPLWIVALVLMGSMLRRCGELFEPGGG